MSAFPGKILNTIVSIIVFSCFSAYGLRSTALAPLHLSKKLQLSMNSVVGAAGLDWPNLGFEYRQTNCFAKIEFKNGMWGDVEMSADQYVPIHIGATALHYGQACFEGLKAFHCADGSIKIFRFLSSPLLLFSIDFPVQTYRKCEENSSLLRTHLHASSPRRSLHQSCKNGCPGQFGLRSPLWDRCSPQDSVYLNLPTTVISRWGIVYPTVAVWQRTKDWLATSR